MLDHSWETNPNRCNWEGEYWRNIPDVSSQEASQVLTARIKSHRRVLNERNMGQGRNTGESNTKGKGTGNERERKEKEKEPEI
jgi:hypothetical protein